MKKEKHLEINENNYKGYVELYAANEKGWISDKTTWKILTVFGVSFPIFLSIAAGISLSIDNVPFAVASIPVVGISEFVYLFLSRKSSEKKAKLQIKEKYPYVDLSLDMNEVEKALKEAKVLVYEKNHVLLDVKSYEQRLKIEKEIRESLKKQDNKENKNLDELIKDSEQKVKENTDSMEEYKDNIKQEKIRLEALKRIREERENQVFYEKTNNIEMPSQEKGLVLRKQKED